MPSSRPLRPSVGQCTRPNLGGGWSTPRRRPRPAPSAQPALRSHTCFATAAPALADPHPTYDDIGRTSLSEVARSVSAAAPAADRRSSLFSRFDVFLPVLLLAPAADGHSVLPSRASRSAYLSRYLAPAADHRGYLRFLITRAMSLGAQPQLLTVMVFSSRVARRMPTFVRMRRNTRRRRHKMTRRDHSSMWNQLPKGLPHDPAIPRRTRSHSKTD
jgi:hypothetical protein